VASEPANPVARDRLGIFNDAPYQRAADGTITTREAFTLFACAVGANFPSSVLIGRVREGGERYPLPLPAGTRVVDLPDYGSLRDVTRLLRIALTITTRLWRAAGQVDRIWVLGPNPVGLVLVVVATIRRRPVTIGIRQDTLQYMASRRGHGPARYPHLTASHLLDQAWKLAARRHSLTSVGSEAAAGYHNARAVFVHGVLLLGADAIAASARTAPLGASIELLSVGRIDREKNPLLLVDALADLERAQPGRFHLTIIGTGPLLDEAISHAASLGVASRITFAGYVPFGPQLLARYDNADLFVHVSLTEGVPQVIVEALARATPVVATDVGSVRSLLDDGRAGLLVAAADRDGLVAAILDATTDAAARTARSAHGLTIARTLALEPNARRVAAFIADAATASVDAPASQRLR
jgi:glycosyltransferase involved in cell wall biosynthesis